MKEEELVLSYFEISKSLESKIAEIKNALNEGTVTKDSLKECFLGKIVDKNFPEIQSLLRRDLGENSPIPTDSKEVCIGESSSNSNSLMSQNKWKNIILHKKNCNITWSSIFPEYFVDVNDEVKKETKLILKCIVLYITNVYQCNSLSLNIYQFKFRLPR